MTQALLDLALDVNLPAVLWGPPGIGKTARVRQAATEREWPVVTVLSSIRQPDDFNGLPWINDGTVEMIPPLWARALAEYDGPSILFLDEISCTPPSTQAALLRVLFERVVGDVALPDDVRIICAANPPDQAASGWDLSMPLANRLMHIDWPTPTTTEWCEWAMGHIARERAILVTGFMRRFPHLLLDVPDNDIQGGLAWPSPRSWEMAAKLIGRSQSLEDEALAIETCVGRSAAVSFLSWREETDEWPLPEYLLKNPEDCPLPTDRLDMLHLSLHGMVDWLKQGFDACAWQNAWVVLDRVREGHADLILPVAASLLSMREAEGLPTPTWLADYHEALATMRRST